MASPPTPAWPGRSRRYPGRERPGTVAAEVSAVAAPEAGQSLQPALSAADSPADSPAPNTERLAGGVANRGRVFRIGQTVHRPQAPFPAATHALLKHLDAVGFSGSPRLLATDGDSEVLSWIPGQAARTPLPSWALGDAALVSVALLLRRFHHAVASFDPAGHNWPDERVPAPYRWPTISHNDIHPGNIIFSDGRAIGLVDFDLAGPGSPIWDLAAAARCWCPLLSDEDVPNSVVDRRFERFALLLDAYGLAGHARVEVAEALLDNQEWTFRIVVDNVMRGHLGFQHYWNSVAGRAERGHRWLTERRQDLIAAVR
jgi:hypothetical protein